MVSDAASCITHAGNESADCAAMFRQADEEHARNAPKFSDENQCRNVTGGECRSVSDGSGNNVFIPLMAGIMMGRALAPAGGFVPVYGGRDPCATVQGTPSCGSSSSTASSGGRYWYSGGSYVGSSASGSSSATSVNDAGVRSVAAASPRAAAVSSSTAHAGGFGESASAHAGVSS